jgi:hypothetical protein
VGKYGVASGTVVEIRLSGKLSKFAPSKGQENKPKEVVNILRELGLEG